MIDIRLIPLVLLSKYSRIKGRIMEFSGKSISHRQANADAQSELITEILRWWNDVQNQIPLLFNNGDDSNHDSDQHTKQHIIIPSHQLLFKVLYNELLLLVYRPVLSTTSAKTYPIAIQTSISSAKAIISSTRQHLTRYKSSKNKLAFPLFWHILLSCTWMCGLVTIYAAFGKETTLDSASR